jgi:AcrR family transcriptional regulator
MPRPKIENAEERLLSAGLNLFARLGAERVNSNAIARRAQLGVGTFYAHFSDKHALLRALQMRTLAGIRAARVAALAAAPTLGRIPTPSELREQVRLSVEAVARFARAHPEAYRVTFGRERAGASAHGPVVSESSRPTADVLKRLQAAGRIDPDLDPDLAARAYLSMEVGTLLWWLEDPSRAELEGLVDTLTRLHPAVSAAG